MAKPSSFATRAAQRAREADVPNDWRPEKLSPSGAGIWLNCAGSVAASACLPEEASGAAAEEGTRAHLLLEVMFALGLRADEVPAQLDNEEVHAAMSRAVAFAKDYVDTWMFQHKGAKLFHEHWVSLEHTVTALINGTTDLAALHPKELLVVDFKYGIRKVAAKANKQLMLYALGFLSRGYWPKKIRLVIIQPRLRSGNPIDEWLTTRDELELWVDMVVEPQIELIQKHGINAPRTAGQWCEWCRARGTCPALIDYVFKTAGMDFEEK